MKSYWWLLAAGVGMTAATAAGLALGGVTRAPLPVSDAQVAGEEGKPMPAFRLPGAGGEIVDSTLLAGKPVVLHLWATWYPLCVKELQDLAAVQREFGDQVAVVAINRAEPLETARRFTDELGVTGEMTLLFDQTDSYYQSLGGFSMPETLFVSADGIIRLHQRGSMPAEEIRHAVQGLLDQR
jgi:cytochrome c biogenesis protein CcmG/thiol:disulfide interchange protein DsbE